MSLTNDDLQKIGKMLDQKMDQRFKNQDAKFDQRFKNQDSRIDENFDKHLKPIHQKIDKMNKKLDITIKYFDTITTKHDKRIKRVEDHLQLTPLSDFA